MKKILMFVATLVWATQSMSEESGTPVESLKVGFVGVPMMGMYPVTPLKKALWAGSVLVNFSDHYKPVPLYGYSINDLAEDKIYKALIEAAYGNVRIAVAQSDQSDGDVYYNVEGVSFSSQGKGEIKTDWKNSLRSGWDEFRINNKIKDDDLIVFTRPLKLDKKINKTEFIGSPTLWESSR